MLSQLPPLLRNKNTYTHASAELIAGLFGLNCLLNTQLSVDSSTAVQLPTIPDEAIMALIIVEADPTATNTTKCIRFTQDGVTIPTASIGMPLGDLSIYEVGGVRDFGYVMGPSSSPFRNAIDNFQCIGIEAGKTHKINIAYFG